MRRASTSARRRLGSTDSKDPTGTSTASNGNNHDDPQQQPRSFRSRSQERSLNISRSAKQRNEELILPNTYSQASSTTGDSDHSEGHVDVLDDAEAHTSRQSRHKVLMDGRITRNSNQVIITSSYKNGVVQEDGNGSSSPRPKRTSSKGGSVVPKSPKFHRRAQSDPFDVSGLEEILEGEIVGGDHPSWSLQSSLPTLPRYPVAETRDLNCWSEPPLSIFKVRGATYLKDKKKVASQPYLMRPRGCDLFLFDDDSVKSTKQPPPTMMERSSSLLNGTLRNEPTLVLNFRFPWGLMLLYFEIPASMVPFLQHVPAEQQCSSRGDSSTNKKTQQQKPNDEIDLMDKLEKIVNNNNTRLSPGERALALWIMGDTHYKNQRLKLIPYVVQGPWVVRNLVTGKPAIIGTKLPVTYQYNCQGQDDSNSSSHLLVAELDIGNSSNTAKRIVSLCRRYMNALTCDIGFVIQGNTTEELPEQMLGSIRIHGIDPLKAPTFV